MAEHDVRAGSLSELQTTGRLLTKVGTLPVVVFWDEGTAFAIEDRCPHMGFPLHQGTVEAGLVTCHWHHARFDLESGCTLDLWADDARGFDAEIRGLLGDTYRGRAAAAMQNTDYVQAAKACGARDFRIVDPRQEAPAPKAAAPAAPAAAPHNAPSTRVTPR